MREFMAAAVQEALSGVLNNDGGPFGAVIVQNGKIIASAHNEVIKLNDPTAHAEVQAIRKAAAALGRFDLSDCELYSSCEPCPMCLGAIHWAKMKRLVFGATRDDAANSGFDDRFIYDVIQGTAAQLQVEMLQAERDICLKPFQAWDGKTDKKPY